MRKIFLALGGNIGDSGCIFDRALFYLEQNGVNILKRSSTAVTTPVDCPPGTPDFINSAVLAETELGPFELLELTQRAEVLHGRPADHGFHEARTVDIDIIWMEDVRLTTQRLTIPHPRAYERDFVMRFLLELDSNAALKVRPCPVPTPCPAPMEGVMTPALVKTVAEEKVCRDFVTPFLRISEHVPKEKEIRRFLEPYTDFRCTLQLMGNSAELLAKSAVIASKFDVAGINLNFGCPSNQVLRHNGGGALLKNPALMREICRAIRQNCPQLPLSVKMRTGFENTGEYKKYIADWSDNINDAPDYFILHSRAVREGYTAVAEDEHIRRSREFISYVRQPVMLNGDIDDVQTALNRMNICNGASFMTGRGWLKDPYIFRNFEKGIFESTPIEEKIRFYNKVLENAEKLGTPYHKGRQIELSQLMFAPDNPFLAGLLNRY